MAPTEQKLQQDLLQLHVELCNLRDLFVTLGQELRDYQFAVDAEKRSESKTEVDALMGRLMQSSMRAFESMGSGLLLQYGIIGGKPWIPSSEVLAQSPIQNAGAHLKQQVRALR